jgi:hypothetical protein
MFIEVEMPDVRSLVRNGSSVPTPASPSSAETEFHGVRVIKKGMLSLVAATTTGF